MNHKIKMIGLDLDGTLLTTKKEVTTYTRKVLEQALAQGIQVLVSTGRPISAIPKEVFNIHGMKYAVTSNGARVLDIETNEVLHESMISMETAEQLIDILSDYDAILEIFINGVSYARSAELEHVYDYFENPSMAEYVLNTRIRVEDVKATLHEKHSPVDKVHGMFKNAEDMKNAYERLSKIPGIVAVSSFGNNLEVNREGTDKGKGLLALGELLGIKREEIMACGDGMNDFEMLKTVGFAVAMENGHPRVKEIADYITVTNDEDGVAKAIEKFALQLEE